jgi:hypothetical protein
MKKFNIPFLKARYIAVVGVVVGGFVLTQAYQNCAPLQTEGFVVMASESPHSEADGTSNHPVAEQEKELPSRKQLVVPRTYVASLFREVFTSTKYPLTNLETLIDKWIMYKGAQYGGACNYYTSYSSRDCSGSGANVNNASYTEDNTVRESFRIQMCENVLGQNASVSGALEKVGLTVDSVVNTTNVSAVYSLFYRSAPAEALVVSSLIDMNKSLAEKNETALNKWRALLLTVCESPGWQLL